MKSMQNAHPSSYAIPPLMEPVETRRLLSAVVENGVLRVQGTDAGESIIISAGKRRVAVAIDGVSQSFALKGIQSIDVRAGAGDDIIRIAGKSNLPASIYGEAGNDAIVGGPGNDRLYGGAGADHIRGGGGHDLILGGEDDDTLIGDQGNDTLRGEGGNDELHGVAGLDDLDGGDGDDHLYGGAGLDSIRGRRGRDVFHRADDRREKKDRVRAEARREMINIGQVPASILEAFNANHPDAIVKRAKLDDDGKYEIEFYAGGVKQEVEYAPNGDVVGGRIAFEAVPEVVREAFLGTFPDAVVSRVELELEHGAQQYKFRFLNAQGAEQEARFNAEGVLVRLRDR